MAKKKNQPTPTKSCSYCIHEHACAMWTTGGRLSESNAPRCPNYETAKDSMPYFIGRLDAENELTISHKAGSFTGDSTEAGAIRVIDCGFTPSAVMLVVMGDNWFGGLEIPMHRASAYIALATREQPYNSSDTMKAVEIVEGGFAVTYNTWAEFNYRGFRTNYIAFR